MSDFLVVLGHQGKCHNISNYNQSAHFFVQDENGMCEYFLFRYILEGYYSLNPGRVWLFWRGFKFR